MRFPAGSSPLRRVSALLAAAGVLAACDAVTGPPRPGGLADDVVAGLSVRSAGIELYRFIDGGDAYADTFVFAGGDTLPVHVIWLDAAGARVGVEDVDSLAVVPAAAAIWTPSTLDRWEGWLFAYPRGIPVDAAIRFDLLGRGGVRWSSGYVPMRVVPPDTTGG